MKVKMIYFSGTENTHFITEKICDSLKHFADHVEIRRVEDVLSGKAGLNMDSETVLGIGYPVYDLKAPEIIDALVGALPHQKTPVPVFIYSTQAMIRLDCNAITAKTLKVKNYFTIAKEGFKTPSNGLSLYGKKTSPLYRYATRFENHIDRRILKFSNRILKRFMLFRKKPRSTKSITFRCVNAARSLSMMMVGEKIYRNLKIDSTCIHCGKCIRQCPEKNIRETAEGMIIQKNNGCLRCLRCITNCPTQSINFTSAARSGNYSPAIRRDRYVKTVVKI